MTPEQFQIFLKDNRESTAAAIKETVNGKIDGIRVELVTHAAKDDANMVAIRSHMEEAKPYMQGAAGLGVLWKFVIALGSLAAAYLTIKSVIK